MTGPVTEPVDLDLVLRWAAGLGVATPPGSGVDEAALFDLLNGHALAGRLRDRLAGSAPSWAEPKLLRRLAQTCDATTAQRHAHSAATAEINDRLGGPEAVLVKGIATYLLTGAAHTERCGDIDLVCADGDRLVEVLSKLGYRRTREPFLHEIGEFTRDAIEIDVHEYFPMHGLSGLQYRELDPAAHHGVWTQTGFRSSLARIEWADLDRHRMRAGRISVPDPTMLAVILCGHAHLNFTNMWSISHRAKPYVKLAELADLRDLVAHPQFDTRRFRSLVDRFGASDAVRWAGWASTTLIGHDPLPPVGPHPGTFPRCIWWSFWAEVPVDPATLVRPGWLDMAVLVAALGGSTVADGTWYLVTDLPRHLRLASNGPTPGWRVRFSDGGRTVTVGLPERTGAAVERVRVDGGDSAIEWSHDTATGVQSIVGDSSGCTLSVSRGVRQITLRRRIEGSSLLVGIAEEAGDGKHTASVLLPLTLLAR